MRSFLRLFVLLLAAATTASNTSYAQEPRKPMSLEASPANKSESLLLLQSSEPQIERKLQEMGVESDPHSTSGLIWLLPSEAARRFRDANPDQVRSLAPALRLQVETANPEARLGESLESLGGIVLESHGRFHEVAVPLTKLPQVRKLPGVVRVSKDLLVHPTQIR
jgi:hypothetical protein